ncbi:adult cuticle protein 1 [Bactrocera oleae]|uniref:adult cuticle protein 1 n=1 Tax=Bactrocera oleae TaxID=104688 RepID=UPI00387ED0DE
MKFVIAAVCTLALAMGVQSSIIPGLLPGLTQVAGHGLSYTAVSGPLAVPVAAHAPAAVIAAASPPFAFATRAAAYASPSYATYASPSIAAYASPPAAVQVPSVAVQVPSVAVQVPSVAVQAPSVAVHAPAVAAVGHAGLVAGGAYVAKTRGAVHSAPLPGHISSVANLNVAPAPGTW